VLRVEGEVLVKDDATLTFAPGLRLEIAHEARHWVGDDAPGELVAVGTDSSPMLS